MRKRSLGVNSILNIVRQMCAVLFPLITFPYATRVLGTEGYGKVSFGAMIVSFAALIACLGVIEYAVREGAKVREDKAAFQRLSDQLFSINMLSTGAAYLLLILLIFAWPRLSGYGVLLMVQSLCMISVTLGTDWINTAYEDYLYIAVRYILSHVVAIVLLFIIVRGPEDFVWYAFVCVLTDILAGIANFIYVRVRYDIHPRFTLDIDLSRHLKPVLILFGTTLASFVFINSDVIMLGAMKDESEVGIYNAGARIYMAVKQVMNAGLAVAIPRIASNISSGVDNRELLRKIRTVCLVVLLPAATGLYLVSDKVILLMSGESYQGAGSVLGVLAIAVFCSVSAAFYYSLIMIPYGMERSALVGTTVSAVVNVILNLIFVPRYGGIACAYTTVVSEFIMLVFCVICSRKLASFRLIKPYGAGLVSCFIIVVLSRLIDSWVGSDTLSLILTVLSGIFVAALVTLVFYGEKVVSYLKKRGE